MKFYRRVSVCQNKLDLIFIAVINFTSSFALKPNDKENVEKKSTIYNRDFKDNLCTTTRKHIIIFKENKATSF